MPDYVLDTSALLTLLQWEEGTEIVEDIFFRMDLASGSIHLPFMTLMELEKDPEFDAVKGLKSLRLPYKPKTR